MKTLTYIFVDNFVDKFLKKVIDYSKICCIFAA